MVELDDMLVMLVSGVLRFCAFAEFRPIIAIMPIMPARIGMIITNCFFIDPFSVLLTYKGVGIDRRILCIKYQMLQASRQYKGEYGWATY
jgi:hypothetical protein